MSDRPLSGPAGDGSRLASRSTQRPSIPPVYGRATPDDVTRPQPQELEPPAMSGGVGDQAAVDGPANGAFIQVLPCAVNAFCHKRALDFDERALLEHLLDSAERITGVVSDCTLTGLARAMGLGPSGRRTTAIRLSRLVAAAAIEWVRGTGTEPGRIRILVHHDLVRRGRGDRRVGYVQVCPAALADMAARCSLSATARALLRRLVVDVDHRSRTLTVSMRQLTARYGIGRGRAAAALDELIHAGLIRRSTGGVQVAVYDRVVRTPSSAHLSTDGAVDVPATARLDRAARLSTPPLNRATDPTAARLDRAATAPESRGLRVQNARPSSLLEGRDQDLNPESVLGLRAASSGEQGQVDSVDVKPIELTLLAQLALALPVEVHSNLLTEPAQRPGRQALERRLARLAAQLGRDEAIETVANGWPAEVASAMALANDRARRRLDELASSGRTAGAVAELVAVAADRRRTQALVGARNLGRVWAEAGATLEEVAAKYARDPEALQVALGAFRATTTGASSDDAGAGRTEPSGLDESRTPEGRRQGSDTEPSARGSSLVPVGCEPWPGPCPGPRKGVERYGGQVESYGGVSGAHRDHVRQGASPTGAVTVLGVPSATGLSLGQPS